MSKLCVLGALCVLAISSASAAVVVGSPADTGTGNCFPFGCAYSGEYQQVYNNGQFSGTITISDLEFFNTQVSNGSTAMNGGTFTISLSTTTADWNTLSSTYASNLGGNNTVVFSGSLAQAWAFGDTLEINLTTPFTYDPSQGNLLMDVFASGTDANGGSIFFDTNGFNGGSFNGNTFLGRAYCNVCSPGNVDAGYGLVTGFSTSEVPEPGTFCGLGLGLVGLGVALRRRRNS